MKKNKEEKRKYGRIKKVANTVKDTVLFTDDEVLWQSEVKGNKMVAIVMVVCTALLLLTWVGVKVGFLPLDLNMVTNLVNLGFFELIIPPIICWIFKGQKKWLKVLMLLEFTVVLARLDSMLTYTVVLLMVIPTALSVRYYSKKLTTFVAVFTTISFALSNIFGGFNGLINVCNVDFPVKADLTVYDNSLNRAVLRYLEGLPYETTQSYMREYVLDNFKYSFIPKWVLFILFAWICIRIAEEGRKTVLLQDKESRKNERISTELNLASDIQTDMLPNIFPAFPERNEFDIYAEMSAAKEVGGDFYDFFMVDDDHLAIVMADVSGKGVPAALFMVIAKTLIKDNAQLGFSPSEVFNKVNNSLCEGNKAELFVTAWMGIIEISTGRMEYVNAGHNPPIVKLKDKVMFLPCRPGLVLAGMENVKYKSDSLQLEKGDKVFLYTDGITEACGESLEQYGDERLIEYLKNSSGRNVEEVIKGLYKDVEEFTKTKDQFDDMTMLVFDFTPKENIKKEVDEPMYIEKTFEAKKESLEQVLVFIDTELEKMGCGVKEQMQIDVAVEEIFVNIAYYAYKDIPGEHEAIVKIRQIDNKMELLLVDSGIEFDPLAKEDPDITLSADERNIGGLGIFMVKKSMDSCSYKRENGQNIFSMIKTIK